MGIRGNGMKKLLAILLVGVLACAKGETEVLLWQVDETPIVHSETGDINVYQWAGMLLNDEDNWPAARVIGQNGQYMAILSIYFGEGYEEDGDWGVEFSDVGGYWGSGVPTGNQSKIPIELMEGYFQMQLGHNSWDDDVGDYVWTSLAYSEWKSMQDLDTDHIYTSAGIGTNLGPHNETPWMPMDFYTVSPAIPIDVPEPNSFILMSLGICLLGLRRRRLPSSARF